MKFQILFLSLMLAVSATAQTKREKLRQRVVSMLSAKQNKISYDTVYLSRPEERLTVKLRANVSGNTIETKGKISDTNVSSKLSTDNKATFSIGANYQGIALGIAINPDKMRGRYKDYELNLNAYYNRVCVDASYHESNTLSGDFKSGEDIVHLDRGMIEMKMFNIAGYYIFNHRRFSFPAAFSQSFIQKRSAGSWLAGATFLGGSTKHDGNNDKGIPQIRTYVGNFAIGGGYGYNLVVGKHWLFHLSALPTLIVVNRNNVTINGERRKIGYHFPEMIFNEHLAIVYNINSRFFLAATGVFNISTFHSSQTRVVQNKWRSRACLGIRF